MSASNGKTKRHTGNRHRKGSSLSHEIKSSLLHPIVHSLSIIMHTLSMLKSTYSPLEYYLIPWEKRDGNSNRTLHKFYRIMFQLQDPVPDHVLGPLCQVPMPIPVPGAVPAPLLDPMMYPVADPPTKDLTEFNRSLQEPNGFCAQFLLRLQVHECKSWQTWLLRVQRMSIKASSSVPAPWNNKRKVKKYVKTFSGKKFWKNYQLSTDWTAAFDGKSFVNILLQKYMIVFYVPLQTLRKLQ